MTKSFLLWFRESFLRTDNVPAEIRAMSTREVHEFAEKCGRNAERHDSGSSNQAGQHIHDLNRIDRG